MTTLNRCSFWKRFYNHAGVIFVGIFFLLFGVQDLATGQINTYIEDDSLLGQVLSNQHESNKNLMSITFMNVNLEEALEILAERLRVGFSYNPDILPEKRINFKMTNVPAHEIIYKLLEGTNLEPVLPPSKDVIILKEKGVVLDFDIIQDVVRGTVVDAQTGESLPGVNIVVEGATAVGTTTNLDGEFELSVPSLNETLVFSYIGYERLVVDIAGRTELNIQLMQDVQMLDDLVVVGYGVQRRSDITGSVASVSRDRLDMVPNQNITQAIQGAVPGIMVQTTSAGARSNEVLMVRGRNSIAADNSPLIVVDGVQYNGNISDLNPNDVSSIEILKDASAAAIYGSRGANGVILVTTKEGVQGRTQLSYDSYFALQNYVNLPNIMAGDQYFEFKRDRLAQHITLSEEAIYNSGEWVDWLDIGLRNGYSQEHNLSLSGGSESTTFYISGSILDIQGLAVNDDYSRLSGRVNIDTKISDWLTIGTRSQLTYDDRSGVPPSMTGLFFMNPLSVPYDENGNLTIHPWDDDRSFSNPLQGTLYDDTNESYQILTNNFVIVDVPFIEGLSNRVNIGIRRASGDQTTYRGRNTSDGQIARGRADIRNTNSNNTVFENIISFNRSFGIHNLFATGVISYEEDNFRGNYITATGFPNDDLSYHGIQQAESITPSTGYNKTVLQSQMLRLNYSYDSRYLATLTTRRDGFSGFGIDSKWGLFPSIALGWNFHNEDFFPWKDLFSEFKPRLSYGWSGNQAVGSFQSIARMVSSDMVDDGSTVAGFRPGTLAQGDLGWESSRTLNIGVDFGLMEDRFRGEVNFYHTNTSDLLLERSISPVHGITSIIENIGETQNRGIEFLVHSRNIANNTFMWSSTLNFSFNRNKILELYGDGRDDVANAWFIGKPININYDFLVEGVWQLDEADQAAVYGSQPGYVKLRDVTGDGNIGANDRQIIGQADPDLLWGLTNDFSYKNFNLNIFIHGVHGATRFNFLKTDLETYSTIRRNTTLKNWWTPDNPTNEFVMNDINAENMSGQRARWYEDASFVRIKDITFSYNFDRTLVERFGLNNLRMYVNGRNLYTFTKWGGLDPELDNQVAIPLQRQFLFGLNLGF